MKRYSDKDLMEIAIEEHLKCKEFPRVGAIIAKDGVILSTGHRGEIENTHAERVAINKIKKSELENSTLYTTLEPCIKLDSKQSTEPCAELIIKSKISNVYIGVLDPNGTIYSQGFKRLLENDIDVKFFPRKLRKAVEEETFEYGKLDLIIGPGKRRIPVIESGIKLKIQFSKNDTRTINLHWSTLQYSHECVDLISDNGSVKIASETTNFSDITDPDVFRFPSHLARMKKDMISIVKPKLSTFYVLIKLLAIYENEILIQWEVRNIK